jgi:hypothetical protein
MIHYFDMLHCFDMLHIATLFLFCYIAQNTPTLPHCFDMLHIATLLRLNVAKINCCIDLIVAYDLMLKCL